MAQVAATAAEQFFLELMNRARLNPEAEAALQGITLNQGIAAGTLDNSQRQVLAINPFINQAADGHSNWMRANNIFSHTGSGGSSAQTRMSVEGYNFTGSWAWGENIAWIGSSGALDLVDAVIQMHNNLFKSTSGHRQNLLNNYFREAGVGLSNIGPYSQGGGTYANSVTATQNFALSGSNVYVTGVSYNDTDANNFYSVGEGIGNRTVQLFQNGVAASSMATTAAGGYSVASSGTGTIEARFSGGGLTSEVGARFNMNGQNVKIDLVNGNTILTSHSATLTGTAQNMTLIGVNANSAIGNGLNNTLEGNAGNNTLDGDGGADTLQGNMGNDTYFVDNAGDVIIEGAADGARDVVYSTTSYGLAADARVEVLSTRTHAATTAINLTGNAFTQDIVGNAGSNTLNGGGGNDTLQGLGGDDVYVIDQLGDVVIEAVGAGNDTVTAGISYTLGTWAEIELLKLNNSAATTALNLTGNGFNNRLEGNAGNNTLDGDGGADTLQGNMGNDTYFVDNAGDVIIEGAADGARDVVYSTTSYGLAADARVEVLSTRTHAATTAINLTGNAFTQDIVGNAGSNTLNGGGGNDTLQGLGGDDVYVIDQLGDVVIEAVGAGNDTVTAGISYTLGTWAEIELLKLNNSAATTALNLTGNGFNNRLEGNAGNNTLDGDGGADTLQGNMGNDTYFVDNAGDVIIEGAADGARDVVYSTTSYGLAADARVEVLSTRTHAATTAINLTGNAFTQDIVGNAGSNTLNGGGGNDTLQGLGGSDTFRFTEAAFGIDIIADFQSAIDKLSFSLNVADAFSDFVIANNGTSLVTVTLASEVIYVASSSIFTLTDSDFLFV